MFLLSCGYFIQCNTVNICYVILSIVCFFLRIKHLKMNNTSIIFKIFIHRLQFYLNEQLDPFLPLISSSPTLAVRFLFEDFLLFLSNDLVCLEPKNFH